MEPKLFPQISLYLGQRFSIMISVVVALQIGIKCTICNFDYNKYYKILDGGMSDTYSEEEMQQILQKALAQKTRSGERLTRLQVQEIAEELGVSQADFGKAEQEWQMQNQKNTDRQEFLAVSRLKFRDHVVTFCLVNGAFTSFNYFTSSPHRLTWSIFLIIFWGLLVLLEGWSIVATDSHAFTKRFEKWYNRRQKDRQAEQLKQKFTSAAAEVTDKFAHTAITFTDKFTSQLSQKVEKWLDDQK